MDNFIINAVENTVPTGVTQEQVPRQLDLIKELSELHVTITGHSLPQSKISKMQEHGIKFLEKLREESTRRV